MSGFVNAVNAIYQLQWQDLSARLRIIAQPYTARMHYS